MNIHLKPYNMLGAETNGPKSQDEILPKGQWKRKLLKQEAVEPSLTPEQEDTISAIEESHEYHQGSIDRCRH